MKLDKCAIIGINSNLGLELAKNISLDYEIIAVGRRSLDDYDEFKYLIKEKNLNYKFIQCDLTNLQEVDILKKKLVKANIKSLVCIGGSYPKFNSSSYVISDKMNSNLIQTHSLIRNSVFFNRTSSIFASEYRFQVSKSKNLLATGFDGKSISFHELSTRWNIISSFSYTFATYVELQGNHQKYLLLLK